MAKAGTTVKAGARKAAGKAAPKRAATKKIVARKAVAKKTARKAVGIKEGSRYVCGVCGLAVTIDTACGCAETSHLICCEKPMKMKR